MPKKFLFPDSRKTNLWDSSLVFAFLAKISRCAYRTLSRIPGVKISRHEEKINLKPVTLVSYRSNLRFRFSIRREKCSSLGDRGARASFGVLMSATIPRDSRAAGDRSAPSNGECYTEKS